MLLDRIRLLPFGYSEVHYRKRKYRVTRQEFNSGRSIKLYAKELGGNDLISLNYYITSTSERLKPCEMEEQKVIDFLMGYEYLECGN